MKRMRQEVQTRSQNLQSSKSIPYADSGGSKQLKHSALKLPKMSLPVFDGDRRKWLSFWDVFKSEVHDVKDISNVTKFNFLKGQLSEHVKVRVEGIMATEDNYDLLVETLQKISDTKVLDELHGQLSHILYKKRQQL